MGDRTGPSEIGRPNVARPKGGATTIPNSQPATPASEKTELIITQADLLPATLPDRINSIQERLNGQDNLQLWQFYIKNQLEANDIKCLIRNDIPKPTPNHQRYSDWNKLSKTIRSWLLSQIKSNIVPSLISSPDPKTYADDAYQAIINVVRGYGISNTRLTYDRTMTMKRDDFGTTEEFVNEYIKQWQLSNDLGAEISPFNACIKIFQELNKELPNWVAIMESRLNEMKPKEVTIQ